MSSNVAGRKIYHFVRGFSSHVRAHQRVIRCNYFISISSFFKFLYPEMVYYFNHIGFIIRCLSNFNHIGILTTLRFYLWLSLLNLIYTVDSYHKPLICGVAPNKKGKRLVSPSRVAIIYLYWIAAIPINIGWFSRN